MTSVVPGRNCHVLFLLDNVSTSFHLWFVAAEDGAAGAKIYVLRSILPEAYRAEFIQQPADDAFRGFALMVLSLVQLSGDKLEETRLWGMLGQMGISKAGSHPTLGNCTELIKRMEAVR